MRITNSNVIVQRIARTQIYNKGSVTNFSFKRLIRFARNGETQRATPYFFTRLSTCFISRCFPEPKTPPIITSLRYLKANLRPNLDLEKAKNYFYWLHQFIIKFPYNARFDWLKQRTLSENKGQVNDIKLAFKFLLRNFDKFDPN